MRRVLIACLALCGCSSTPTKITTQPIVAPVAQAQEIDYEPYMDRMQTVIKSRWAPPKLAQSKHASVTFNIAQNGGLTKVAIGDSSGNPKLDKAAIEAVKLSAPFDPLPAGSPDTVEVSMDFNYTVHTASELKRDAKTRERIAEAYNNLANVYMSSEDYLEAAQAFTRQIAVNPTAQAYEQRGLAYKKMGKYKLALADLTRAIAGDTKNGELYHNRGLVYYQLGQYEKANKDAVAASRLDPDDPDTYNLKGATDLRLGQYKQSIDDFSQAIAHNAKLAANYYYRAAAYFKLNEYDKAIDDCTAAISLDPQDPIAHYYRGQAYSSLGKHDQAIKDYSQAIALNPDMAQVYYARASVYSRTGHRQKARQDRYRAATLGYRG